MEAVVSDILRNRKDEPGGLTSTAALSLAAHGVVLLALAFVPGILPKRSAPPAIVMTISLGGSAGPRTGGMSQLGGRTIQAAAPSESPKAERVAMPTPKAAPSMVLPVPDPKVKDRAAPKVTTTSKDPSGRAGRRGQLTEKGSATVETGARGAGFGLSTGGGGTGGARLDVANFCCPEYIVDMVMRIRAKWVQQQEAAGSNTMKFVILRNGQITAIELEQSSNIASLDLASQRALILTDRLQPLPSAFPDERLPVHLQFDYLRK